MVFLSGSRTTASGGLGDHVALIFRATENITINLLRVRIHGTGSGSSTACLVRGFIVHQVPFNNLDSTLIQINLTAAFSQLSAGDTIIFEQVGGSRYNSSANFELDYTPEIVEPPPPPPPDIIPNIAFTYTFPDGHTINGISTQFDFSILQDAPKHTAVLTSSETFDPVNATPLNMIAQITAHKESDVTPPPPPEPETNVSVLVDLHDGHFVSTVLSESDFNQLHAINISSWDIVESTFTSTHPFESFTVFLNRINEHIEDDNVPPPPPPPPIPDENQDAQYHFPDGHVIFGVVSAFESTILLDAPRHTATLSLLPTNASVNSTAVSMLAAIEAHKLGDVTPPPPPPPIDMISQNISITFTDPQFGGFNTSILISEVGDLLAIDDNRWTVTLLPTPLPQNQPLTSLALLLNDIDDILTGIVPPPPPPTTGGIGDKFNMFIKAVPLLGIAALFFNSAKIGKKT